MQAAKTLININCRRFLILLEKFSRFLVEQELSRTQCIHWSPRAEEWGGPQGTEPQPSVHKPPRDSWCAGRERKANSQKGWKKQPRELHGGIGGQQNPKCAVQIQVNSYRKGDGVKLLLPSRGVCPLILSP